MDINNPNLNFIISKIFGIKKKKNYNFDILIDQNNSINNDTCNIILNYQLIDYYYEIYDILIFYLYHDIVDIIINDYIGYNIHDIDKKKNSQNYFQYCKIFCFCLYELFMFFLILITFFLLIFVLIMAFIYIGIMIYLLVDYIIKN